jgi:surface protein
MSNMFFRCRLFNQDIGSWITNNVTDMNNMFTQAFSFNQDISDWNVSNVANFTDFMAGKSADNYDAQYLSNIYEKWSLLTLVPNLSINFGSIKYNTSGAIGKNRLLNAPNNYIITDGGQEAPFAFSVKTDNAGVSTSTQFRMPLTTSTNLGFTVNWGDGVTETITAHTLAIHTYASAGTYNVSVTGAILGWVFNEGGDRLKMLNVSQWAGLNISSSRGFSGCTNMTCTATDAPLITTTALNEYVKGCSNFNGQIGNWNVSNILSLQKMFDGATSFNQPLNNWDTANVVDMFFMFEGATAFNQDIGSWNVSNVTTMGGMFASASSFNQNIGAWDVSKVTSFASMFSNATAFNNGGSDDIDNWTFSTTSNINMRGMFTGTNTTNSCKFNRYIGSWDTQRVTNMQEMFFRNTAFNQNIGAWNVSAVTSLASMFWDAMAFNNGGSADINNWDTSNVISMQEVFRGNNIFNQPIGDWDTSSVTTMYRMFEATAFNQPIGDWDTSSVTTMFRMFNIATAFNQDIGNWNVSNVTNFTGFMLGRTAANYSAANLDSIYNGWSSRPVQPNLSISFGTIKYTAAGQAGKDILTGAPNLWTIVDAGI